MDEIVSIEMLHEWIRGEINHRAGEINDFAACHEAGVVINTRYANDNPQLPVREVNVTNLRQLLFKANLGQEDYTVSENLAALLSKMDELRGVKAERKVISSRPRMDLSALKPGD